MGTAKGQRLNLDELESRAALLAGKYLRNEMATIQANLRSDNRITASRVGDPIVLYDDWIVEHMRNRYRDPRQFDQEKLAKEWDRLLTIHRDVEVAVYMDDMFRRGGQRVFRLAASFIKTLRLTDSFDCTVDELQFPFPSCYFEIPFAVQVDGKKMTEFTGALVVNTPEYLRVFAVLGAELVGVRGGPAGNGSWYVDLPKNDPTSITKYMREYRCASGGEAGTLMRLTPAVDGFGQDMGPLLEIVLKAAVYLTCQDADVSPPIVGPNTQKLRDNPQKSGKWRKNMEDLAAREFIVIDVGRRIHLDPRLEEVADSGDEKRKLNKRTHVRGFFRNQACGVGRLERKRIFVAPFWRGPELGEVINRKYLVVDSRQTGGETP